MKKLNHIHSTPVTIPRINSKIGFIVSSNI